jgi:signal transduction histidine kinase
MKILSVDDKVDNLYLLEVMLKGAGYQVVSAYNGVEALQYLDQDKFDLIISDILMPQMDGFELCHKVKQRDDLRQIPFIFYTATYTEKKDQELGLRLGASRFIIKPLEPEQFLAVLAQVIQEYERGRLVASSSPPVEKEEVLLKAYNLSLVRKLDQKVQQVEQAAQELRTALEDKERELTARLKAQEELRHARDELVQANADLERKIEKRTAQLVEANANLQTFTYTAAHDLHAPLRSIKNLSKLAVMDWAEKLGPEGRSMLQRVAESAEQMQRLLHDLLEYSKTSHAELKLEPVNLGQAVSEALALLEEEIRAKNAVVTVTEPLPDVVGHFATVVLLVNNLVSNALKFMPQNLQPQVRVWAERRNIEPGFEGASGREPSEPAGQPCSGPHRALRLWVEDNGIGIAQQHLEKIFGAFERLHSQHAYAGTGLGLPIVRKGVERMGGRVGVESQPGKGSRFWVELRMAET